MTRELRRADRYNQLLSLVMMDIDDFKPYNDENGHEIGNEALAMVARLLSESLRTIDVPARYGGEEFAFILPTTPKSDAQMVADRARSRIAQHLFPSADGKGARLTVSMGIATFPTDASTADELIRHADSALYVAKTRGKNQVHLYGHCRRSAYRIQTALQGTYRELAKKQQPFTAVNLSERGLMLHVEKELGEGTLLDLDLKLPTSQRSVAISGRVSRVRQLRPGEYEAAIRVIEMPAREQRQLVEFIRNVEENSKNDSEPAVEEPVGAGAGE